MNHQLDYRNSSFDRRLNAVALIALEKSPVAPFDSADAVMRRLESIEQLNTKSAPEAVPNKDLKNRLRISVPLVNSLLAMGLILYIGVAFARSFRDTPEKPATARQSA